ncbi:N-acetyltransferase [Pedobacter frigiditerrae]|uniref:N-acetyltransferase n=1 Tax=Pedobacter frigiditerrae TaxID=2530452 RepID=A0A4V2MJA2_9SPHI|nr:GNAT family N-acetyltransferase [Pedobacter frigiditerrae]TCC93516.1 N-acetyltransferase [Pedobacter frigiditerrae]
MYNVFPNFLEEGFQLRQIVDEDINKIFLGLSHPDIVKYYGVNYSSLYDTQEQMKWFAELEESGTGIWWAINSPQNSDFYGAIGLNNLSKIHQKAEIGFWLLPEYWGKGIMKIAVDLVCNYAFKELKLHRIEALVETENKNSKNLLNKLSFNHEGTFIDYEIKNGNFISLDCYAKLH